MRIRIKVRVKVLTRGHGHNPLEAQVGVPRGTGPTWEGMDSGDSRKWWARPGGQEWACSLCPRGRRCHAGAEN